MDNASAAMVEISQDGAGLAIEPTSLPYGFYTEDIETCAVYAFRGRNGLCVIHDTGHLVIGDIVALVERVGGIESVSAAQNSLRRSGDQDAEHRRRLAEVLHRVNWLAEVGYVDAPQGWVAFSRTGEPERRASMEVEPLPGRTLRRQINLLNNLFTLPNSQSVRVDLQHVDQAFTPPPGLAVGIDEMMVRARQEMARGDPDYLFELRRAWSAGMLQSVS